MDLFVIGDQDTVLGFQLVGGAGKTVESIEQAKRELEAALQREDVKILLITREWAEKMRERIDRLKMTSLDPIVMEIPGREAEMPKESVSDLVRRAIGINI